MIMLQLEEISSLEVEKLHKTLYYRRKILIELIVFSGFWAILRGWLLQPEFSLRCYCFQSVPLLLETPSLFYENSMPFQYKSVENIFTLYTASVLLLFPSQNLIFSRHSRHSLCLPPSDPYRRKCTKTPQRNRQS